ncbi:hypothetical protein H7X46_05300 [Pseudonocardia sp. C8]|uniref:hypothetical protein n=1 Tax=Pseudonocardia sp. C8 TaxID=2762759 RepID=UPI0016431995|nr:hypothetical protein [Pseudonocardia sp. C8]MBC3190478.1 hypothetical protein [Pseudonocardia sp. C8]
MGRSLAAVPFRVWAVFHGLLVLAQVGFAGALLDAVDGALDWHGGAGGSLIMVALVQTVLAVPAAWPGGMPAWSVAVSAALVVADVAQVAMGHAGLLAVHVPLGIAIVATQVTIAVRALAPARRRRPAHPVTTG